MTPPYIDALKGNLDDNVKVKISTVQDLKDKLEIPDIKKSDLEEYFDKPFEATKRELSELRQKYMTGEPKFETIRDFLINKKNTILENTKEEAEKLKKVSESVHDSLDVEQEKNKDGKIEGQNAEKGLNEQIAEMDFKKTTPQELSNKLKETAPAIVQKGKEALGWAEQLEKNIKGGGLLGVLSSVFLGILNFLKGISGNIKDFFGGNKKEEIVDAAKDKIDDKAEKVLDTNTPEYNDTLTKTQDTIIKYIETGTGEKLDDKTKEKLRTKLSPNEKGSIISPESFEKLTEKIKSGGSISFDDLKDTQIIRNILTDRDLVEIKELLSKNINKKLFDFFKAKFEKSGVTFNAENEGKLKGIINRAFENTMANKLVERTKENGGEIHFDGLEGVESIIGIGTLIPGVIFEAYNEDIIKAENITMGIIESGKETITIGLKALNGENIIPDLIGRMNWDQLDEKLLNTTPEKKILLERAFYSELGLVSSVLGTIGFYGTSSMISLIESGSNKIAGKGFSNPPIDRLEQTLNIIGKGEGTWLKDIESALQDTKRSYEIVNELKTVNITGEKKGELSKELGYISKKFTDANTGFLNKQNLSKITEKLNPLQTFHFTKSIEQLQQIAKTNEELGVSIIKGSFPQKALEAKQFIETFKIRYIDGRAVLNITEGLKAKEFAKALGSLSPEIIKGLFKLAPTLIVGHTIIDSLKEQKGEWYETLIMLNGFVGGMQLFKDTEIDYTKEGLKIKNPASFAGGVALVGMETVFFGKEALSYFGKGQYIRALPMATFNSFVRLPLDAIKGVGWAGARGFELLKIAKSLPKKGKIGLGVALLLGAVSMVKYGIDDKIDLKKLEEDGLLVKGEPNMKILKQKWPDFDNNKKEDILTLYSISMLDKSFKGKEDKFSFKLENGKFKITINKELENNKLLIDNLLEEVSRFLTDIESNIKLDISFE